MKLNDLIKTTQIKVPNTDLVIEVKTELSWLEYLEYTKIEDLTKRGKFLLTKIIVSWNLENEEGNLLPITEDIVGRLPANVGIPLAEKIAEIVSNEEVKKKF
jgi:hypothetical protein